MLKHQRSGLVPEDSASVVMVDSHLRSDGVVSEQLVLSELSFSTGFTHMFICVSLEMWCFDFQFCDLTHFCKSWIKNKNKTLS